MINAIRRASALSGMPGKIRRSSIVADDSPPRSKAAWIAAMSLSEIENIGAASEQASRRHEQRAQGRAVDVAALVEVRGAEPRAVARQQPQPIFNTFPELTVTNSGKMAEMAAVFWKIICSAIILSNPH